MLDSLSIPLKYESLGRAVIPAGKAGDPKRPHIPWKTYQYRTPDPDDLLEWQERFSPTNWGVVCGPVSNVSVVDCDTREACDYYRSYGLEPAVTTPHGLHFYVASEGTAIRTSTLDIEGVPFEVKGCGSLATFYGPGYEVHDRALHPDGLYSVAELPCPLRTAILSPKPRKKARQLPEIIPNGERNLTLFHSWACSLRGKGMPYEGILAALREVNKHCTSPLSDSELRTIAGSADKYEPEAALIEIWRGLKRVALPDSARRVFDHIVDETTVRGRLENWISASQFEEGTGLPQRQVWKALSRLKEMRMVSVRKKGEQRFYKPTHPREWATGTPANNDRYHNQKGMEGGRTLVSLPPKSGGQGDEYMKDTVSPVTTRNSVS